MLNVLEIYTKIQMRGNFSWIPAGEDIAQSSYSDETKLVRMRRGFWMSKYLITQEFMKKSWGMNPSFLIPQ